MKRSTAKLVKYYLNLSVAFVGLMMFLLGIAMADSSLGWALGFIIVGALIALAADEKYIIHMQKVRSRLFNIKYGR